ncbi:MAG TPA: NAD-dependent epimerase/dehydratase family protein [Ktedonobacterales bacterium]|nr:NAD-dependent epimerase/dehydratase family protein [Ktedonobacterales bacterium]
MTNGCYVVTGGAGFVGSHIAEALAARGETVRVFDNLSAATEANLATLPPSIELIEGDLCDLGAVRAALDGAHVVFHHGAVASVPRSVADPAGTLATNVTGTQHVLLAAREAGVRRLVFASSSAIYGNRPELPKREDQPPEPLSPYAVHKLAGEQLCSVFTRLYGLETVALRYFNIFGPRQNPASEYSAVIPRVIADLLEGRRPVVYGDGEQTRDFIYIGNVVRANLLAAEAPAAVGRAINIGCGERMSVNTLLRLAGDLLDMAVEPEYRPARPGDVRDSLADISSARQLLGFEPEIGFREGLAATIASSRQAYERVGAG